VLQQVASRTHLGRIDVGHGDHAAAEQDRNLVGIDFIVLGFTAMNGFHIEGVAQDEFDALLGIEIGQPVPAEDTFDGDD